MGYAPLFDSKPTSIDEFIKQIVSEINLGIHSQVSVNCGVYKYDWVLVSVGNSKNKFRCYMNLYSTVPKSIMKLVLRDSPKLCGMQYSLQSHHKHASKSIEKIIKHTLIINIDLEDFPEVLLNILLENDMQVPESIRGEYSPSSISYKHTGKGLFS